MSKLSKRQEIREKRRKAQQRQRMVWIGIISAVVVVIAALFIVPNLTRQAAGNVVVPTSVAYPDADGTALGDPNAPVKVEMFSDFLCSHCQDFTKTQEPGIIEDYVETGQVYYIYRPFRVIAPESDNGAMGAMCAADQNRFWEYHDVVFENVGVTPSPMSDNALIAYATALNLDVDQFTSCLKGNEHQDTIRQEQAYGVQKGITGTPSFLINDTRIVNRGELVAAIDQALAETGEQ